VTTLTIIETLARPELFGTAPTFQSLETWAAWLSFLKAVYGLPMSPADVARFRQHTERNHPRPGGYPESVVIVGCQSGKSQIAAVIACYEAACAVAAGRRGLYVPLVAQDSRAAQRVLFRYCHELTEGSPALRGAVRRETTDAIELTHSVTLAVYPCRPAAIRGLRAAAVVIDELAFFTATDGRPTDTEMLRAARSRVATTGGKLLILSSPYGPFGALWELHRRHYGREGASTLVWQASAPAMNPTLPADYLEKMAQDDPDAYRSEVLGEFRTGLATCYDPDLLDLATDHGVRERPPQAGVAYRGFVDAASGSGSDSFTCAVAHAEGARVVLDAVRAWPPPFNPDHVLAECAAVLQTYRLSTVTGDRYAGGFVTEGFARHGVRYQPSDRDRSQLYLDLVPLFNAGRVRLLDDPALVRELRGLERRRGTAGRDRIDHRPGAHDDRANAAAGALTVAAQPVCVPRVSWLGDDGAEVGWWRGDPWT
jgi:hypothetical protein